MKFCVKNNINIFEFHDSVFSFVMYDGKDLIISASRVNIHKDTLQNTSDYDMEIAAAQITFRNINIVNYMQTRISETDENGKNCLLDSHEFSGKVAINRFLEELKHSFRVYHFEKDCNYSIGGTGIESYFEIDFSFDEIVVCWDEYINKAWYELHRQYQYDTVLHTPSGDKIVKLMIFCNEESDFYKENAEQPMMISIGCTYEGKEYWGYGNDYLWIDAFVNLQKHLPANVLLKCCLTCRHGNFCPVGNYPNEVFCTKNVVITQKSDLYFYTEDDVEREKRLKHYCDFCEDYQQQTEEFFCYNDYAHYVIE